jgi:hypothetical protein
MSALGQKRTFTHIRPMSALPPKTDIRSYSIHLVGELLYRKPPGVGSGHPKDKSTGFYFTSTRQPSELPHLAGAQGCETLRRNAGYV